MFVTNHERPFVIVLHCTVKNIFDVVERMSAGSEGQISQHVCLITTYLK